MYGAGLKGVFIRQQARSRGNGVRVPEMFLDELLVAVLKAFLDAGKDASHTSLYASARLA